MLAQWQVKDPGFFLLGGGGEGLPKVRVAGYTEKYAYTLDPTKSEWADYAVQA